MPDPSQPTAPQNLDLERSVLGVILSGQDAVAIQIVRQHVPHPLVFADRSHRLIYLACLDLDEAGVGLDVTAVAELLSRMRQETAVKRLRQIQVFVESDDQGHANPAALRQLLARSGEDSSTDAGASALAAVGGAPALYALTVGVESRRNLEYNCQLLRDYELKRRLLARLTAITDETRITTATFSDLLAQTDRALLGLRRFDSTTQVHGLSDVVGETLAETFNRQVDPEGAVRSICDGIAEQILPLRLRGLYVLGARPGAGKTSFALHLVRGVVTAPDPVQRVMFVSLDVGRCDLVRKLIAAHGKLPFRDIDMGTLSSEMSTRMETSAAAVAQWPIDIVDAAHLTVHELRAVVKRRLVETNDQLKLVVVDYLQLLAGTASGQDEATRISENIRVLKIMALECGVAVLVLSKMIPEVECDGVPCEPRIADLPCSRAIEPDADAVLFLHRVDTDDDEAYRIIKLMVAKNSFGYTSTSIMRFVPATMSFEPVAP